MERQVSSHSKMNDWSMKQSKIFTDFQNCSRKVQKKQKSNAQTRQEKEWSLHLLLHMSLIWERSHHTSVHSSLSSMSLLRWKTIFLERDSSSSGAISGSSSHCKSKTFSWLWVTWEQKQSLCTGWFVNLFAVYAASPRFFYWSIKNINIVFHQNQIANNKTYLLQITKSICK